MTEWLGLASAKMQMMKYSPIFHCFSTMIILYHLPLLLPCFALHNKRLTTHNAQEILGPGARGFLSRNYYCSEGNWSRSTLCTRNNSQVRNADESELWPCSIPPPYTPLKRTKRRVTLEMLKSCSVILWFTDHQPLPPSARSPRWDDEAGLVKWVASEEMAGLE